MMLPKKSSAKYIKSKKGNKRKLLIPLFLIVVILFSLLKSIDKIKLNINFSIPKRSETINPILTTDKKVNLENILVSEGLKPLNMEFTDNFVQASLSGNTTAFFSLKKDLKEQVVSLQFIITRTKIENKLPRVIDLRFAKPVVSY